MRQAHKGALLLAVAPVVSAGLPASAQAIEITPDNTAVTLTTDAATDPTMTVAGSQVVCDEGTLEGTTGVGQPNIDLHATFQTNCEVFGFVGATVTCVGTWTLEFTTRDGLGGGNATADLDSDYECTITASSCHIEVVGPQDPTGDFFVYTAGSDTLESTVDKTANVISTCFGGPPAGSQPSDFTATYTVDTPANLTIGP